MSKHRLFRFKQFSIDHSRATMKVGTDGVLLGAWVNVDSSLTILDIGTGAGVIALMMAQRSLNTAVIDAVEIEPADAAQALENVRNSPWPDKVVVHCTPIQEFRTERKYDLIVSNPPFFRNSSQPPDARRFQARHAELLPYEDLVDSVARLIEPRGRFNVILPPAEGELFIAAAIRRQLHLRRKFLFRTRAEKAPERWLMEFSPESGTMCEGEVLLYSEGEQWSEQYKTLTRDFYLNT